MGRPKKVEDSKVEESEVKTKEVKSEAVKSTDVSFVCVDAAKLLRAKKAVAGTAKPDSSELKLAQRLRGQYKDDALIVEIYRGLGGLVDSARATKNRENEKTNAKKRASR